jgi:hypothetical protein
MRKIDNDVERYRVRRTLAEVKTKLEEALRLSEQLQRRKGNHDESTAASHRR